MSDLGAAATPGRRRQPSRAQLSTSYALAVGTAISSRAGAGSITPKGWRQMVTPQREVAASGCSTPVEWSASPLAGAPARRVFRRDESGECDEHPPRDRSNGENRPALHPVPVPSQMRP